MKFWSWKRHYKSLEREHKTLLADHATLIAEVRRIRNAKSVAQKICVAHTRPHPTRCGDILYDIEYLDPDTFEKLHIVACGIHGHDAVVGRTLISIEPLD